MGDYFYYGYNGEADNDTAVMFYTMAAKKNDPQVCKNNNNTINKAPFPKGCKVLSE